MEQRGETAVREAASVAARLLHCADLMRRWPSLAEHWPGRAPDYVIGDLADPYLLRWWLIPRSDAGPNLYLHWILQSDDDRALHDHPWANTTVVRAGGYREITRVGRGRAEGSWRHAGDVIQRAATAAHRLVIPLGAGPAVTVFATGPKEREWGFWCPQGWVPWREFTDPEASGRTGRGCGEAGAPTPASTPGTSHPPLREERGTDSGSGT